MCVYMREGVGSGIYTYCSALYVCVVSSFFLYGLVFDYGIKLTSHTHSLVKLNNDNVYYYM